MIAHRDRFVVRLHHDRRVVTDQGPGTLQEVPSRTPVLCEREVPVTRRQTGNRPQQARKKHPPRDGRVATLQFAARRLTLQRPQGRQYAHLPAALDVQVVYAWEVAVPPGEEPVEWRLITTDPVDTVDQVLRIVDWYRTRWLIESFSKP